LVDRRGCGPAGGQWDDQDGKAAAESVKDCGVGQGCTLPGWGFLRLVEWQLRGRPVYPAGIKGGGVLERGL
jgi:hypothetical protein